jgi:protein gp37
MGQTAYQRDGNPRTSGPGFALTLHPERLGIPLTWPTPRRIFVDSMSDLFHPEVPDEFLDQVFAVMAAATRHTFQVLTKRPERMRRYMSEVVDHRDRETLVLQALEAHRGSLMTGTPIWPGWPLPNVWLGTSVENARWRTRMDELRRTPAAVRFLSCEPLLGPLTKPMRTEGPLSPLQELDLTDIGWVIVGGESGPAHRIVDPQWVRDIRDACIRQGVPFLFKQWGGKTSKSGGRELDGRTYDGFPNPAADDAEVAV